MNIKTGKLVMSDLEVQTIRKNIKNIHIGVYPPNGRVRVAAPLKTTDDTIRLIVLSKIPWIRKQQDKFAKQKREAPREYVSGESHYFSGQRYILDIIMGPYRPKILIAGKKRMNMFVHQDASQEECSRIMEKFYRRELRKMLDPEIKKWEEKLGVHAREVKIRKMKTKWGSANTGVGRIWFNLELAKKSQNCLSFVVLHELTHLIERHHNENFKEIVTSMIPNWRLYRDELNDLVSGDEEWPCEV